MAGTLLNRATRCDRCGAEAFVVVRLEAGSLYFCGHHFREHEAALRPIAVWVHDERDRINEAPSTSANV